MLHFYNDTDVVLLAAPKKIERNFQEDFRNLSDLQKAGNDGVRTSFLIGKVNGWINFYEKKGYFIPETLVKYGIKEYIAKNLEDVKRPEFSGPAMDVTDADPNKAAALEDMAIRLNTNSANSYAQKFVEISKLAGGKTVSAIRTTGKWIQVRTVEGYYYVIKTGSSLWKRIKEGVKSVIEYIAEALNIGFEKAGWKEVQGFVA